MPNVCVGATKSTYLVVRSTEVLSCAFGVRTVTPFRLSLCRSYAARFIKKLPQKMHLCQGINFSRNLLVAFLNSIHADQEFRRGWKELIPSLLPHVRNTELLPFASVHKLHRSAIKSSFLHNLTGNRLKEKKKCGDAAVPQ